MFSKTDLLTFTEFKKLLDEIAPKNRAMIIINKVKDYIFYNKNILYIYSDKYIAYLKVKGKENEENLLINHLSSFILESYEEICKDQTHQDILKEFYQKKSIRNITK